jgi:hypothetical protein
VKSVVFVRHMNLKLSPLRLKLPADAKATGPHTPASTYVEHLVDMTMLAVTAELVRLPRRRTGSTQ